MIIKQKSRSRRKCNKNLYYKINAYNNTKKARRQIERVLMQIKTRKKQKINKFKYLETNTVLWYKGIKKRIENTVTNSLKQS